MNTDAGGKSALSAWLGPGDATMEEDGCVCLDWAIGDKMLTLSVFPTGAIAYAWSTPGNVEPSGHGNMHAHPAVHEILAAVAAANDGA